MTDTSGWLSTSLLCPGLIAVLLLQLSCVIPVVSTPEYPSTWPALEATPPGACAEVAGTYTNSSLQEDADAERVKLLKILLGDFAYRGGYPSIVHLEQPDAGTLVITGSSKQGTVVRQVLSVSRGTLECTNDGLQIKVPTEVHLSDGGGLSRVFVSRSEDGSLILRDVDKAMMGASGIVILAYTRRWYRFPVAAVASPDPVGPLPERLTAEGALAAESATETALLEVDPGCRKSRCLLRVLEMDSRTMVYNHRFDTDLDPMRLPPGRFRLDNRYPGDPSYSSMEATLAVGRHYLLRSVQCKGNLLPQPCPYRTNKRLIWLEEQDSGAIAGGDPWWNEVTYREHPSPMVIDIPKRGFWSGSRGAREPSLKENICNGVLIDRVVIKSDRKTIGTNSPSGEARAVKLMVKLSFYNRGDSPRFVTPRTAIVQDGREIVVMEGPRQQVDRQSIETLSLRSDSLYEEFFLSLLKQDPAPVMRVTVVVENPDEAAP